MRRSAIALAFVASLPSLVRAQATPNPVRTDYQWTREKNTAAFEGFDGKLFMAGGKYSVNENGTQRFIYRNDVWSMSPRSR
jgi:hypothetical protein